MNSSDICDEEIRDPQIPIIYQHTSHNGDIYLYNFKYQKNDNIYLRCKDRGRKGKAIYKLNGEIIVTKKCNIIGIGYYLSENEVENSDENDKIDEN